MSSSKKLKLEEDKTTISGFIQHVSPVKTSRTNNRYFNATLQTQRDTFNKLACFDASKHSTLVEAGNAKTPLKLNDVQIVPSKLDSSKSKILINYRTRIEVSKQLTFTYQTEKVDDTAGQKTKSVIEIKQHIPERNKVAVDVKILQVGQVQVQIVRESPIKKQDLMVADQTQTIKLTIWEDLVDKLQEGKSYNIKNLSTRLFQNEKTLTATKETTCELIEDIPNCHHGTLESDETEKTGKITQAFLQLTFSCENCKAKVNIPDDDSMFLRCTSCKMKMKKDSVQKSISGNVCFDDHKENVKLSIFSSSIFALAIANNLNNNEIENIEDFLLSNQFKVRYTKNTKAIQDIMCVSL